MPYPVTRNWHYPGCLLTSQLAHRQSTCLKHINRVGRKGNAEVRFKSHFSTQALAKLVSRTNWQATPSEGGTGPPCPPGGSSTQNMEQPGAANGHQVEPVRQEAQVSVLTTDVLFHPSESDPSFFAALAEPQQEGARGLCAKDGPLPLLADETHDVPAANHNQSQACWGQVTRLQQFSLTAEFNLTLHSKGPRYTFSQGR